MMPVIKCPRCDFETEDAEAIIAAAILNAHSTEHNSSGGKGNHARPPPVERPKLSAASPVADWEIFKSRWRSFKVATNIDDAKKVHQLLGCLEPEVVQLVYSESNSPETLTEDKLLDLIKKVAVNPENQWVTREKLHSMTQDQGEPITGYAARLKGQARLCERRPGRRANARLCS